MKLNPFLAGRGHPPPPKLTLEFDFVIAKRPKYIPGSGPPLTPISMMPSHDKDGYIIKEVMLYSELRYLVGYEKQPHLRVSVKMGNILNWVSEGALEGYHVEKYEREEREREETELPWIEAKEERRRKRLVKLSRADPPADRQSRKRKRTPVDEVTLEGKKGPIPKLGRKHSRPPGPGRRNQPVEEGVSFTSPKQSQHSQQQASLSAGRLANRTLFDSESDDEDSMATEMALEYQLKGGRLAPSNLQPSHSTSEDASPPPSSKRNTRNNRSRSASKPTDISREDSPSIPTPGSTHRRSHYLPPSILSGKSAVAATSGREAFKVFEDLERKRKSTIADEFSFTRKNSLAQTFKGSHVGLAGRTSGLAQVQSATEDEETDEPDEGEGVEYDEQEYEFKKILDDKLVLGSTGQEEVWYKIEWVGEWDDTWEPAENVGHVAIREYEDEKHKRQVKGRSIRERGGEEDAPDSLSVIDRRGDARGEGKEVMRGQVIDDDDDSEDTGDDEMQGGCG